jgi:hypothetical protein
MKCKYCTVHSTSSSTNKKNKTQQYDNQEYTLTTCTAVHCTVQDANFTNDKRFPTKKKQKKRTHCTGTTSTTSTITLVQAVL